MTPTEIEKIFRDDAGRALATLIRLVGDFDLAEDALQDAFAAALERWPAADPPSHPRARRAWAGILGPAGAGRRYALPAARGRWPAADPPSNPRAWLVNVGRNKAIDRVRRQITFRGKRSELTHELLANAAASDEAGEIAALDDDMLRLIFTCCHPAF